MHSAPLAYTNIYLHPLLRCTEDEVDGLEEDVENLTCAHLPDYRSLTYSHLLCTDEDAEDPGCTDVEVEDLPY